MRSPDYTRLAAQLPPVYQDDPASYVQVDAYLGLADELNHAIVERLEDLALALGPDATLRWPSDLPLNAGADALLGAYLSTYDGLARWVGFTFPAGWPTGEPGVQRRREFLARSTRLWRRRGTPRGFLSWFAFYFGLQPPQLPYLVEHFKAPGGRLTPDPWTATLFVPATTFEEWARREQALDFVRSYAPAHVAMRTCFVDPDLFDKLAVLVDPPPRLPTEPTAADLQAYRAAVATQQANLNGLLCSVVSEVSHDSGVHVHLCIDEGRNVDRLDVGLLPTEPDDE